PQPARLYARIAVQADRHALHRGLAPRAAGLVLPAGDRHVVAAGLPAAAATAAGLAAAPAARRSAPLAAARLERAGAGVLQREPRQARGLHLPDAAGAGRGCRAAAARIAAQARDPLGPGLLCLAAGACRAGGLSLSVIASPLRVA